MIVADGSAIVTAATDPTQRGSRIRARLARGGPVAAPHLVDAEIGQGIRGLALRGVITLTDAERSRASAELLVTARFAHRPYGARAWQLRDNVSFYDGLYVALAEHLGAPLLTADRKLAGATGPRCPIELV